MRIRSIKPEFFKHDILGTMSPLSRLLFIGLWCMADCAGRMEDRPKRIKVEALPYDDTDVEVLLCELEKGTLIVRYAVGDQRLIEIPSFLRHQRITGKESEASSRFPGVQKKKVVKQRGSIGEALGKHPESLETEGKRKGNGDGGAFALFWSVYPKKKAKDSAAKAFEKVTADIQTLLSAVELARRSPDWTKDGGKFIPYPATWLNGKRWEDAPDAELLPFVVPPGCARPYDAPSEIR